MNKFTNQHTQDTLIKAVKLILRPLIRLLIHHQVTFPYLRELLKEIYIEAASEIIKKDSGDINNSRLYILTGVHRKDIKRIREQDETDAMPASSLSLGGALIARWTALPEFLSEDGLPRKLKKTSSDRQPGFDQLVIGVSKDIRPRAMLDEWLRQGIVSLQDNLVALNEAAFIPAQDFDKLCYYLGHNMHDHFASATHNLLQEGEPMLERSVYYANLTEQSVQKLRQLATTQSMQMLSDINKQAMAMYQHDKSNPQASYRFRLGSYWHQQDKNS